LAALRRNGRNALLGCAQRAPSTGGLCSRSGSDGGRTRIPKLRQVRSGNREGRSVGGRAASGLAWSRDHGRASASGTDGRNQRCQSCGLAVGPDRSGANATFGREMRTCDLRVMSSNPISYTVDRWATHLRVTFRSPVVENPAHCGLVCGKCTWAASDVKLGRPQRWPGSIGRCEGRCVRGSDGLGTRT
jgi:hypothetical protein